MIDYARIDHHDRDWSAFLPAVLAQTDHLRSECGDLTSWLQLGWIRGPHVIVGFQSAQGLSEESRARVLERLRAAVQKCPSQHSVDEVEWHTTSLQLAREDLIEGPYLPLHADNTVSWIDINEGRAYLEPHVAETMGLLLAEATGSAVSLLTATDDRRADWVFTGMAVLADEYRGGGMRRGYLSYLSHWKEFLRWQPAAESIEATWNAAYLSQRDALVARIAAILRRDSSDGRDGQDAFDGRDGHDALGGRDALDGRDTPDAMARQWRHWVGSGLSTAEALAAGGLIGVSGSDGWATRAAAIDRSDVDRWQFGEERGYSDFHTEFRKLDTAAFGLEREFASYRFLEAVQFRLFSLAGVSPLQRRTLAYFFSRAVEDHFGITWQQIVGDGLAHQSGSTRQRQTTNVLTEP